MPTGNLGDCVYPRCTEGRTGTNRTPTTYNPNPNTCLGTDATDQTKAEVEEPKNGFISLLFDSTRQRSSSTNKMTDTTKRSIGRSSSYPSVPTGSLSDCVYLRCTEGRTGTNRTPTTDNPNPNTSLGTDATDQTKAEVEEPKNGFISLLFDSSRQRSSSTRSK